MRKLTTAEIAQLQANHCTADDWNNIEVAEGFTPAFVSEIEFSGRIRLGRFDKTFTLAGGVPTHSGLYKARLHNVIVDDDVCVREIHNYIANYHIGEGTYIENTNVIVVEGETTFGNGVRVPVMNEGGGREIPIFDGLSAHLAYILALYRHNHAVIDHLQKRIDDYADAQKSTMGEIGKHVRIVNCGLLKNVRIGDYATLGGTSKLKNGSVNSNVEAPVQLGSGVKCTDFIISSGVKISDSTLVSCCFVGQGCIMDKHYSALDSLFFANCQGMHGEATAIFAGPYTVSHHKSSLLIAGMFSFLNAGSGSNQSNHMYKLGPIHQGVVERGAKTTSDSYLLWPARIGAFTLVMGRHTKHCDTSALPFSYLIENATESYLVPAVNLRSVGTVRDAQKWPKRDARRDSHKLDQINFNLLSPYTIQKMMHGIEVLENLQKECGEITSEYAYQNCRIRNSSLRNGIALYKTAIVKFLGNSLISRLQAGEYTTMDEIRKRLQPTSPAGLGEWCDLSGLIAPQTEVNRLMADIAADNMSLDDIQRRFETWHRDYYEYEWTWACDKLLQHWGKEIKEVTVDDLVQLVEEWKEAVVSLDKMLYDDAKKEFNLMAKIGFGVDGDDRQKVQDFESVRGRFDSNPFVCEVLNHIERKSRLGDEVVAKLQRVKA
ncbi:MAG: DUF4954 family protein [Paludibacteraceae bacterium]